MDRGNIWIIIKKSKKNDISQGCKGDIYLSEKVLISIVGIYDDYQEYQRGIEKIKYNDNEQYGGICIKKDDLDKLYEIPAEVAEIEFLNGKYSHVIIEGDYSWE